MFSLKTNLILILCVFILFSSFNQQQSCQITKEELIKLYKDYYIASRIDSLIWNGSVKECKPGYLSDDVYRKAEKRVNFFRLVNRLPEIKFNPNYHKYAQHAALMMTVNKEINHYPPKTWKCYTKEGAIGAENSCLTQSDFKNFPENSFITGFVDDAGDENYFCGHRRWILYSKASEMAYGATGKAEVLYVVDKYNNTPSNSITYTAYPWNGCVPYNLIFAKWSFSIPDNYIVDFSKIKMTIRDNQNREIPFKLLKQKKDFLDHTITWKMPSMFTQEEEVYGKNNLETKGFVGKELIIRIENVLVNKATKTFEYRVKIVKM